MLYLSKSKYCNAVQCPKMLWLNKYKTELFNDELVNGQVLENGNQVGDLAMGLFGNYTEVEYGDLSDMIEKTEELIESGEKIIAEASFSVNGLFCSVDILKVNGSKTAEIYEVKSSTSVHGIYIDDIAFQYHILTELGWTITRACLVHIDNSYVRRGELEPDRLFKIEDLTDPVAEMQNDVKDNISFLEKYMMNTEEPAKEIGPQCTSPYACGFWDYCSRHVARPGVFDISRMQTKTRFKLFNSGIVSFEDIEKNKCVNPAQMLQVRHELYDLPPEIDVDAITEFMKDITYPLYFLDFESFQPAVPLYDETKPYQQIVFQYSLHYIEYEGAELKHKEFLAYPGKDPRRGLAEQLCRDIPKGVCTTAYNMSFEKGRIKELAQLYPDLQAHLMDIHDGIRDLMIPFEKKWYYSRGMQGSYSIKFVLPALYPDDPELDYHSLEGVHNGSEASAAFTNMASMTEEEMMKNREYLLKYCGLDTYAMVKVWQKLLEVCD